MAEFEKIKFALKCSIRKSQETFLLDSEDWEIFDGLIVILLGIVEDFGFTKEQVIALYEGTKKEVEEEFKNKIY